MIVLMKHPILEASIGDLQRLKNDGLTAEQIVSLRDPNDYCIFGTGELVEELMKRYEAINTVFPEVFELLRWDPVPAEPEFRCGWCAGGGGRVCRLLVCGHWVHLECRRGMERCGECGLRVQEPQCCRIKHTWRWKGNKGEE